MRGMSTRMNAMIRPTDATSAMITHRGDFVKIPTAMVLDPVISHDARGLLLVLCSVGDGWTSLDALTEMASDTQSVAEAAVRELVAAGYAEVEW